MKEELKVGKWYRLPASGNYIAKYSSTDTCSEYITNSGRYCSTGGTCSYLNAVLVNLQEIRQYLPDLHPDKLLHISKEQKQKILNLIREI